MPQRKIIHIDMDAFFASVEQRDHPELCGKPIAIGYDGERGVVSTASYEARRFGVRSAMSMMMAKRLCPRLIVVPARYEVYRQVSDEVMTIFHDYTDIIEPLSIDEAFLDVTENKRGMELAVDVAREIKRRVKDELRLTASAGVSYNKLLAKIASEERKPDGLCTIHPDKALDFIARLRIEKLWGVGPKTAQRMHYMGIFTGRDLRKCSLGHLKEVFGKSGQLFYEFARGIDHRPVVVERVRKSVGCEHTFREDISRPSAVIIELYHTVLELVERIAKDGFEGKTLTLKVKFGDFRQITRSVTQQKHLKNKDEILPLAKKLLTEVDYSSEHPIRLIGLSVSNPADEDEAKRREWIQLKLEFKDWPQ
ncbi:MULTISPECIES: DNA polymerase IV [Prevotella]|uniref:DNA polymerase IV n=1 Tax=Prevotella TaxID=838 RepID=UPI003514E594